MRTATQCLPRLIARMDSLFAESVKLEPATKANLKGLGFK